MQQVDVIVLGAGIIGVSTAVHLRLRGLEVALIDRRQPGEETSMGPAGIIARNGFCPDPVPSDPAILLDIALKQSTALTYDLRTLIKLLPWLRSYVRHSGPQGALAYARAISPLRAAAIAEHHALAPKANADRFYRKNGWLQIYRSRQSFSTGERERHFARIYGIDYQECDASELAAVEPGLRPEGLTGVYWPESESVSNPAAVTDALWRYFIQQGGLFLNGDAMRLTRRRNAWWMPAMRKDVSAPAVVVALGPWSGDFAARLGEKFPLAVSRGYHLQFRPSSGASLSRPVMDMDHGYVLSPVERGIRLTTGTEIAWRDAPPNPVQLASASRRAADIFALGQPVPAEPWMGSRPYLPDSLPVLGASAGFPGIWYNFGHGNSGFTFGPVCGRVMADLITTGQTFIDTLPFSPLRFVNWK
ncbi:NAD(P)/FAD-dependent oxidoreductase [Roseibium litorale]|uniref:FAD-binding oxidoreductase n=1 Tax=Roseibium litorale TaxID=2803841 RepID=A0ABR9CI21_9HYPH|nr:FAD-binding oxidoreductase [Roseibium litorale]MBD8890334.1 FAD-binding oxidoreductase [Roseibium litorale]